MNNNSRFDGKNDLPSNKGNHIPNRLNQISHGQNLYSGNKNQELNKINNRKTTTNNASLKNKVASNKQKNRGLFSRFKNNASNIAADNNSSEEQDNNTETTVDDVIEKAKKVKKLFSIFGIIGAILPILFIVLILIIVVSAVQTYVPFLGPMLFNENNNENASSEEKEYYRHLNDLVANYQESCHGEQVNKNLIHSVIIYYYYKTGDEYDYSAMTTMLDNIFVDLPSSCGADYTVNGNFFNNLSNDTVFEKYYSRVAREENTTYVEILKEIFELSENLNVDEDMSAEYFVAEDATVTTNDDNNNVSFKQYLSGSVYANISNNDLSNTEKIKALSIASTSNVLAKNNISLSTGAISLTDTTGIEYCSLSDGCSYDNNKELVSGSNNISNGNNTFNNGGYYYKVPLDTTVQNNINKAVDNIYGYVLVDNSGKYVSVDLDKLNTVSGSTYQEMIKNAYGNVTIKNIRENTYISGVNFGNEKVLTDVIFYDQKDYNNVPFCGLKHSIGEYGCGITAMAMVLSTYEKNNKYDPVYTMNQAYKWGQCGSGVSGTAIAYYKKQANAMGYHYLNVGKRSTSDKNLVLSHLSQGHLIVYHVLGPNIFTGGGHYMVLSGVDPETGKVYVNDPNNKSNKNNKSRKSGNGWYSFNDVIIPAGHSGNKPFHIIWKD